MTDRPLTSRLEEFDAQVQEFLDICLEMSFPEPEDILVSRDVWFGLCSAGNRGVTEHIEHTCGKKREDGQACLGGPMTYRGILVLPEDRLPPACAGCCEEDGKEPDDEPPFISVLMLGSHIFAWTGELINHYQRALGRKLFTHSFDEECSPTPSPDSVAFVRLLNEMIFRSSDEAEQHILRRCMHDWVELGEAPS